MRPRRLKLIFYLNVIAVILLVTYKIYLNFFEQDYSAVHAAQVEAIQARLAGREDFSFAVVGNINNSVGIFERKIIPMLNAADVDFVVSAGNAVSGPGEDKYRAIYRTLNRLDMPYVLTAGPNEMENFGARRYYRHFGPYFFTFSSGNSRFIFLDSSTETSFSWQLHWLREVLANSTSEHTFVFLSHPLQPVDHHSLLDESEDYLNAPDFRRALIQLFEAHEVDAVFSANLHLYSLEAQAGTNYITTGGAGGLVLNNELSFYHFVRVSVAGESLQLNLEQLNVGQHKAFKTLESFWFFIHSLFYVGHLNFILLLCFLLAVASYLYSLIFVDRDYYPNFDLDPTPFINKPLRIAMVTNNYLPFIGGVPVSIERLRQGLLALGKSVFVVAPRYRRRSAAEDHVLRVPSLLAFGEKDEFRMANIFLPRIGRALANFKPDIVHLHHPVWLGSAGLFWARRLNVPAIYTYHTRLEHYAHFVILPSALFRNLIAHYLVKRFANKCDAVIVPTRAAGEYLRIIGVKADVFIQPSGIDVARFQQTDTDKTAELRQRLGITNERVLVSVSRLSREKNIAFMLDALHALRAEGAPAFRFVMVGDGGDKARLQERVRQLQLEDVVTFVGAVPPEDVANYYQLANAFLFASRSETQGMVILEAMAAGLPVVAVRSSGIDDFIHDGINGFKTPANIAQWRLQLAKILDDPTLAENMGHNARRFAADFAIDKVASNTAHIYAQVLAARVASREKTTYNRS